MDFFPLPNTYIILEIIFETIKITQIFYISFHFQLIDIPENNVVLTSRSVSYFFRFHPKYRVKTKTGFCNLTIGYIQFKQINA